MTPIQTATLVTTLAALAMLVAGLWVMHRTIPATPIEETAVMTLPAAPAAGGRHRFDGQADAYRPRAAAPAAPRPPVDPEPATEMLPVTLTPEDRTFLEAVTAQPMIDSPDPFAAPASAAPDDWFGVPDDDTRQLDAV